MNDEALDLQCCPRRTTDADRVDAHAAVGGCLRGGERVGRLVVLAVGEQNDDGRRVNPLRHGRRRGCGRRRQVGVEARCRLSVCGNRTERGENAVCQRRAKLRSQAVDRGENGLLVVRGRLHRKAAITESDDADQHAGRLVLYEVPRGGFGRLHPGRLHIVRGHAAGNVKGEDDGAFDPGQVDDRLRACQCQHQERQAGQE